MRQTLTDDFLGLHKSMNCTFLLIFYHPFRVKFLFFMERINEMTELKLFTK